MAQPKQALGKGLASLFGPTAGAPEPGVVAGALAANGAATAPASSTSADSTPLGAVTLSGPDAPAGATQAGEAQMVGVAPVSNAAPAPAASTAGSTIANKDRHPGISVLALDEIKINPYQPRREFEESALEELAQSIRTNGIIQPIVVRKQADGYQLIAGERRLRAATRAGLKQVPVVIRRSTDREALELALVENIQRRDLNCIDEALAYFQLMEEFRLTQEQVAEQVGKDRATVANLLRLLKLPEPILEDLRTGKLTPGHGRAILGIEAPELRIKIRAQVIERGLSVRDTERLVDELKQGLAQGAVSAAQALSPAEPSPVRARLDQLALEWTRTMGSRVAIQGGDRKGKIVIQYRTRDELERLITRLGG